MKRHSRVRTVSALTTALASLLVAGCGVPLDDIPRSAMATTTTTGPDEASVAEEGDSSAFLFFITNNMVANIVQEVPSSQPDDVLTALFAGPAAGTSNDIVSQIPTGTRLLGVRQVGTLLQVDVSEEFDNLVGTGRTQATAQIVLTATDLSGIDSVTVLIDGQPTQLFSPESGDTDRAGACDYLNLFPTEDLITSWPLDSKSQRHLVTRRSALTAQCGPTTGSS